jgi:hypothetical protein
VTAVDEACADLQAALPLAQALLHLSDHDGTMYRPDAAQPHSRPPWNTQAADALTTATEAARQLEASWRSGHRRPYAATGAVLASIVRLSYARDEDEQHAAAVLLTRVRTPIEQLAAVDRAEHAQRVTADCPYCGFGMLRVYPKSGRVACLSGSCTDTNGDTPTGHVGRSHLDGSPRIEWADGLVT